MAVFKTEAEFHLHGVEHLQPSAHRISQDCGICSEPLALVKSLDNTDGDKQHPRLHSTVRVKSCRHIHGTECLTAWLKTGNTCPTCGHMLYLPAGEQPLTQQDVDAMMRDLSGIYPEDMIARSLARYMYISDAATVKIKQIMYSKIAMDDAKQKEKEEKERMQFMLNDDDFLDSDIEWKEEDVDEVTDYEDGEEDGVEGGDVGITSDEH
jgi:hypothetical protein